MIILILLALSFHLTNIAAIACVEYNITHSQENDTLTINFSSNDLLKLDRKVRCASTSSLELVNGCAHHCIGLGYGQHDIASIEIENNNGTIDTCSIEYITDLQSPSLAFLNITDNKVRLGITPPIDSFDYVNVQCSDNESYIIFNASMPFNNSLVTVDCSFLTNISLMSFVLQTIKKGFNPAVNHISREIPLPISFTYSLNSRVLAVIANPPPLMNLYSTYEFQLIFYDGNNENISYERTKVSNLKADLGAAFNYALIPNLKHKIIFKHIVDSIGYAQSNATIPPISNISYPFPVTNLRVREEFNNINLTWIDTHDLLDPIEYIVLCNSSDNSMRNVGRNTTYLCENMLFNETNIISVQTRVAIPGYTHDRTAVAQINVEQIPEIPLFKDFDKTENSITIRWNFNNNSLITNSFVYGINCGLNQKSIQIDIQSNEYKCQSLDEGTLYVITMFVVNIDNTIQRSISINANTLLQECQYKTHFYSPDLNGIRSVIIEWNPPEKNFDKINVFCPMSYITYEYSQIMPTMFVKCMVTSGVQYTVKFDTVKSGFEIRTIQFTDIAPRDITTTTTTTTTTTVTTTTPTTPTTPTTVTTTTTTTTTTTVTTTTPTTTTTVTTTTPTTTTTTVTTTTPTTTTTVTTTTTTTATIITTTTTVTTTTTTTATIITTTTTVTTTTTTTATIITTTTMPTTTTTATATISPATTTTATIITTTTMPTTTTTTATATISSATTITATISPETTTTTTISTITTATTIITSTSPEISIITTATTTIISTPATTSNCSQDELSKIQVELSRWRTAAIVAFIVAGFLVLATICLTILSVLLCLRNRYNNTDE